MDRLGPKDGDFEIDLESGGRASGQYTGKNSASSVEKHSKNFLANGCIGFADGCYRSENGLSMSENALNSSGAFVENSDVVIDKKVDGTENLGSAEKKTPKEKRKKSSNKKPPRPPRPPRGPSLDSADEKLIKEISELAILKRARIERMKAVKKMKAAKSSSSTGSILALVFTALFCLVIIFQGISSRSPASSFEGSPFSGPADGGLISVQYYPNPSARVPNIPVSESPNFVEQVAGSDPIEEQNRKFG